MFIDIASVAAIPIGESKAFLVAGRRVLVVHSPKGWFALDDHCPHQERTLEGALVKQASLECPWHSVEIELTTGAVLNSMGFVNLPPVRTFSIEERNGRILVDLPPDEG